MVIGGDASLSGAQLLYDEWPSHIAALAEVGVAEARDRGARRLQVVGLPGAIDDDLYGTDMAIGSDSALNTVVRNIDQLVSTANAHQRTFIIEVMGRNCGYLALFAAIGGGAERAYLPEEGITLAGLRADVRTLLHGFRGGKKPAVVINNEHASPSYDTDFLRRVLDQEGGDLAEARATVLGHLQRGGPPSAFDRLLGARLGAAAAAAAITQLRAGEASAQEVGVQERGIATVSLTDAFATMDLPAGRPRAQLWWPLRELQAMLGQPEPEWYREQAAV